MENNFKNLDLDENILKVIEELGFKEPTSIQKKAIPYIFKGKDVVITAATGSGKTLSYVTRIIQNTNKKEGLQALILVPTRELAIQVGEVFKLFTKYKKLNIMTSYGGGSIKEQKSKLKDVEILIGTLGRISDYVEQDLFELGHLKTVVLDEVDTLVQKQSLNELNFILKTTPKKKQFLVLSATIPKEIYEFIKKMLFNPKRITIHKESMPKNLKHNYYEIEQDQKLSLLSHLIENERSGLSIIFTNRQDTAEFLEKNLKINNMKIKMLHGEKSQGLRNKIIKDFKNEKFDILICTDIIARGLDIDNVTHIYNYNIPKFNEKYIHRAGRTARAGAQGKVINLVCENEIINFLEIINEFKLHANCKELPQFEEIKIRKDFKAKKNRR